MKSDKATVVISFRVLPPIKAALVKVAKQQRVSLAELMAEIAVGAVRK